MYVSNSFYCRIRPERLLYDAERDLLAIAKFFVDNFKTRFVVFFIEKSIDIHHVYI